MKITQNFTWEDTVVELVIFLPNYNGANLTRESLIRIKTVVEPMKYLIIVGNDGVSDDFSDLGYMRVRQITLHRENNEPRNGAFIRNYVIKRCKSRLFFQKDGEVCLEGDFIWNATHTKGGLGWRAGNIVVLNEKQTKQYIEGSDGLGDVEGYSVRKIEPVKPIDDFKTVQEYLVQLDGQVNFISYYHYAFCTRTKLLQGIRGYDERFTKYGWEDVDLALRMAYLHEVLVPDSKVYAVHLYHKSTVDKEALPKMKSVFASNDYRHKVLRNPDGWGGG